MSEERKGYEGTKIFLAACERTTEMFKTMPKCSGVYGIYNATKDMWYIGFSKNINGRLKSHYYSLNSDTPYPHYKQTMLEDWKNDLFAFFVIEETIDTEREVYWTKKYNSVEKGYNRQYGHQRTEMKGSKGHASKLSDEDVKEIRRLYKQGYSYKTLASMFNVHIVSIDRIVHYRSRRFN